MVQRHGSPSPVTVHADASLVDVAGRMRDDDVSVVTVIDAHGRAIGVVTDRDIVVRAVAEHVDPAYTAARVICSPELDLDAVGGAHPAR